MSREADFGAAVEWVREALPHAVAWAEADWLATRRSRLYHANLAVKTGVCAIGHPWRALGVFVWPPGDHMAGHPCGYCLGAAEHEHMWRPPAPALRVDPLKYASPEARANWKEPDPATRASALAVIESAGRP